MTQRIAPRPGRPVWVWVITIFYSFSALFILAAVCAYCRRLPATGVLR